MDKANEPVKALDETKKKLQLVPRQHRKMNKKQKDTLTLKKLKREAHQLNKQMAEESVSSKTLLSLVPRDKKSVKETLGLAIGENFDSVIIFGFKEDSQQTYTYTSSARSVLEIIGALEAAKQYIWNK